MRKTTAVLLALLSACGGGGYSDQPAPAPAQVAPGRYGMSFSTLGEFGELVTDQAGVIVYTSKPFMAFGDWTYNGYNAVATLTLLVRPVDDLNNEFPSAKDAGLSRQLTLAPGSGSTWAGGGVVINLNDRDAPFIASIPRNWQFSNLYNFAGVFLDYTMQLDVDTAGVLSGFDTNGCQFTGELDPPASGERFYRVSVSTSLCGATNQFIDNADYEGYAYVADGPGAGQRTLTIAAVARPREVGIAVTLFAQ